jgi:hypothetical protein
MSPEQIAEVCHEANRALTKHVGDVAVQPPWNEAPEEMRASSIKGVLFALKNPDATPSQQHDAWAADKIASGWTYGETRDDVKKTHPALKTYAELPEGTRRKDALFRAVVATLKD